MAAYFAGSELVEQDEWPAFTHPLLAEYEPAIVSLQWAPRVWAEAELRQPRQWVPRPHYPLQRAEHEVVVEAESGQARPILELDADQEQLVVSGARDQHFPLMYQQSVGDRWRAGFDWWSNARAREAMKRALEEEDGPAISVRMDERTMEAVTGRPDELALLFKPIYYKASEKGHIRSAAKRWQELRGFVVVAIDPDEAVEQAMARVPVSGIDLHIFEKSDEQDPVLLDVIPSRLRRDEIEPFIVPGEPVPREPYERLSATVGGREVVIYATPTEHFLAMRHSWAPDIALGSGLVVTGLLAVLLGTMLVQMQRARQEAVTRRAHAERQAAVAQLGQAGLQEPSLRMLMDRATEMVRHVLEVDFVRVMESDASSGRLRVMALSGWDQQAAEELETTVGSATLSDYTLASKEPVVVEDLPKEQRFRDAALEQRGVVSGVSTLIESNNGRPCGALGAFATKPRTFSDDEVAFLEAVASLLGQAIIQHRTKAELRRLNETLEQRVADRTDELERAQRFLDSIIESIPHMIFIKEAKEFRFVRVNKAGEDLLGYTREEMIGKSDYDFFPAEEAAFFNAKDREVVGRGKMEDIAEETVHTRHDGTRTLHTKKVPLFDSQGEPAFLLGISEDITERKEAEQRLERMAGALKRSNDELEQFAYIASHDLQEPLRKVEGFGQMLQDHLRGKLDAQSQEYLDRMDSASQRMRDLINGLLTYSRVTTKQQPFELMDLNEVAQEVISDLELRIRDTRGQVEVDDLPTVYADRLQMRQLLQNLIGNGLKFSRPGEPPRVKVRAETAAGEGDELSEYRLLVEDNGIGIDTKHVDQLFKPFKRLHGRSSPYTGTGVGLAVCRKIAERHGGWIEVESAPDEGATFIVTLPYRPGGTDDKPVQG